MRLTLAETAQPALQDDVGPVWAPKVEVGSWGRCERLVTQPLQFRTGQPAMIDFDHEVDVSNQDAVLRVKRASKEADPCDAQWVRLVRVRFPRRRYDARGDAAGLTCREPSPDAGGDEALSEITSLPLVDVFDPASLNNPKGLVENAALSL